MSVAYFVPICILSYQSCYRIQSYEIQQTKLRLETRNTDILFATFPYPSGVASHSCNAFNVHIYQQPVNKNDVCDAPKTVSDIYVDIQIVYVIMLL